MKIRAQAVNTDNIEVVIELKMLVSEWKELAEQLPQKWPSWQLGNEITRAVRKLDETYTADLGEDT